MATRSTRNSKKKNAISVDFSGTESQQTLPEGDYLFEVDEIEQKTSSSDNLYLSFTFKVHEGEFKGKKVWHNCSLQPQALFNLRGVLEALGYEVPQGVMDLDTDDLIGEVCGGSVQHETYEGKSRPRIVEFFSPEEAEEEKTPATKAKEPEPEPEKPAATRKKTAPKKEPESEFEVGSKVSFVDDEGDELEGKVLSVEDGVATVKVGKEEWELPVEDLTAV